MLREPTQNKKRPRPRKDLQRHAEAEALQKKVKRLTPHGRQLLAVILKCINDDEKLTRAAIAKRLDRPHTLYPHDRNLLKHMVASGLLDVRNEPMQATKTNPYRRGYSKVYEMKPIYVDLLNSARKRHGKG